jgi:ABC-type glutathione transport system ATPase component
MTVSGADGHAGGSQGSRPVIEVRNLTKRYGPVLAVDDLSFTVAAGEVSSFLGPNGSDGTRPGRGMSTLSPGGPRSWPPHRQHSHMALIALAVRP